MGRLYYILIFFVSSFLLVGCVKSVDTAPNNLFIPTAFTPNGDGTNDVFLVKATPSITYYHVKIFDNSNILLYESGDLNTGWNGSANGDAQPAGSYLWSIEYQSGNTSKCTQSGYVQLIR